MWVWSQEGDIGTRACKYGVDGSEWRMGRVNTAALVETVVRGRDDGGGASWRVAR